MNDDFKTRSLAGLVSALIPIGGDFMKILPPDLRPYPAFEPTVTYVTLVLSSFACVTVLFVLPKPLPKTERARWARWAILWVVLAALGFIAYYEFGLYLSSVSDQRAIFIDGAWGVAVACLAAAFTIVGSSLPKGT